jgi:UDP-glucose 4-epimerase/UDP-arabinose 4-epimerase
MSAQRHSILVTGGAGYIGAHTCKALAGAGYLPIAFDNLSVGHRNFVRWGPLIEADIGETAAVIEACRTHHVSAAIHFAASALVGESVKDPGKYYRNNVAGTLSLAEGLRAASVNTIVMSSSCAVYGVPEKQPIDEQTIPNPINPYGASKLMAEQILSDYEKAHGWRWSALRYFNACGADADADIGEVRAEETHLIPRALMWIQGYIDSFSVFGTDYPTADGTAIRDYIHVSDLADAHVAALRRLQANERVGVLNLGIGRGYSVLQVLKEIERVTGVALRVNFEDRRAGDPPVLIADPRQAQARLQFAPSRSDLETIIRSAWFWHQKAHPRHQSRALSAVANSNS